MSGPAHNKPSSTAVLEGEEENSQDDLKQAEDQQKENLSAFTTETEMMGGLVSGGLAAFTLQFSEWQKVIRGFKDLNNPNFRHQLLKVVDTTGFHEAHQALNNARSEVEKQRKRESKKKNGKDTAHIGLWGNHQEIKFADFDRRDQAFQIGAAVQNHVTTEERFIRTQQAFGLDDIHAKRLRDEYATWQTKNKGKGIDEYIASTDARNIYREQYKINTGKELDQKTEKKGVESAYESDKKSRVEAIKNSKEVIKKGQTEIKDVLDSGNTYTQEQVDQKIQTVTRAQTAAPTPTSTSAPVPAAPAIPAPTPPPPSLAPTPPPQAIKNKYFGKFFNKISVNINLVKKRLSGFLAKVTGFHLLRTAARNFAARGLMALRRTAFRRFITASTWGLTKKGIGVALGIGSLGASVAIMVGWEFVKKIPIVGGLADMLEKVGISFIINSVKVIAVLVIAVPLIILFFSIFQGSKLMDQFISGKQKIVYSPMYEQAENWKNFENSLFTLENNQKITWDQMEKNLFTLPYSYLSLDPNRHDQVQK